MKNYYFRNLLIIIAFLIVSIPKLNAQSNQYLDFDGTDDWVSAPNASALIANSNAFSMAGWFYDNALGYGQGLFGFRSGTQGFYMIELNNGTIECRFINSSNTMAEVVAPANTIIPNMWQHYAWVYDGSSVKLYLNGTLVGSKAASGTINTATMPFAIGKSPIGSFNFYWKGRIDEVSVWNKALTPSEIQGMMQNELIGNESGLKLYYKFNQGVPGANNQSITKLNTEINGPLYDGDLTGFALSGNSSNFLGTLDTSFQAISFPPIPTKLTSAPPFKLNAVATSGLPVGYTLVSGPATLSNDSCYITGAGTVVIKAYQNGNTQYDTAVPVINTFDVVNPLQNAPIVDVRHPMPGTVYMPTLNKIQLAAKASINYSPMFSVQNLVFKVNGITIATTDFANGHYTAWWQPTAFGPATIDIEATSNMGAVAVEHVNINIVQTATDTLVQGFSNILLNVDNGSTKTVDGILPSYLGAYDTIIATLTVSCPNGGCGEWDRIASVDAQSPEGNWFEIIRYITPYGKACSHNMNVTDYMSILQGKVSFRVNCGTTDNGYIYALNFQYKQGTPSHIYSQVKKIWKGNYNFGDYANMQPVGIYNYTYPANVVASTMKLVSTGHGWGNLNTGNAAEFYDATHNIWVNGVSTFSQHNWKTCNPNPDNCMPQSGTWQYNRAGWCPGSIAQPFNFNMTPYVSGSAVLKYVFYENYVDLCHPNHPACVTGTTCTDCNDGFNPYFDVNCNLVNFFDVPPPTPVIDNIASNLNNKLQFALYPNPAEDAFYITSLIEGNQNITVEILSSIGSKVKSFDWDGKTTYVDVQDLETGIYLVKFITPQGSVTKKLIVK